MSSPLRVLVADDHAPTRAGVRLALEQGGCEVCAEAANADDAVARAVGCRPDVCVIDLGMRGSGIRAVSEITARLPGTAVLVLTVSASADDLFDALTAGAAGYLLKDMDPAELPVAVRALAAGEGVLPGALTARLIEEFRHRRGHGSLVGAHGRRVELSSREWQVLELLGRDATTAEIARRLFVSPVTVRRHVSSIMHKLGVSGRAEARGLLDRGSPGPLSGSTEA
jgi:DNA-binding NarL/FixJ family response regulator